MTRRRIFVGMIVVAALALAVGTVGSVFAQGGRGGRAGRAGARGMMGAMMYLERSWTAVSFQLDCTSEQLEQLRPTYRTALQTRDSNLQASIEAQDRDGMVEAVTQCRETLEAKLQEVLSDAQWTKLQELMEARMGGAGMGPAGAK